MAFDRILCHANRQANLREVVLRGFALMTGNQNRAHVRGIFATSRRDYSEEKFDDRVVHIAPCHSCLQLFRTSFFGLTPDDYCTSFNYKRRKVPYHYWTAGVEGEKDDECAMLEADVKRAEESQQVGHRFFTERRIFRNWAKPYNFSFYVPSWNQPS